MKKVVYSAAARKALRKLPPDIRTRITAKLERFAASGAGDVIQLTGQDLLRLRIGSYRALFADHNGVVLVSKISHRSTAY